MHSSSLQSFSANNGTVQKQQGFTLFEVLIAALILAVAVAGVMRLHTQNLRNTAGHDELQRAYWIVSNAQQRFMRHQGLSSEDLSILKSQASSAGLTSVEITNTSNAVGVKWQAWDSKTTVQRGCLANAGYSCIQVVVGKGK